MQSIKVDDFSLQRTLESGQFFHFKKINGWYYIHDPQKIFKVRQEENELIFEGVDVNSLKHFLGIDENYAKIKKILLNDEILIKAVEQEPGIRLMKLDPWQCAMSFICSSFSNVKKIIQNVYKLSTNFGEACSLEDYEGYTFPKPGSINDIKKVKNCAVGFRAKYLIQANSLLSSDFFKEIKELPYEEAKQKIKEVPGIGDKVGDCILLFSLNKTEAFPVDVWISRVMKENFKGCKKMNEKKIADFGRKRWGKLAGYAQQYLYHWRRMQ